MKKVIFVLPVMHGGGAERVAALLMNKLYERGFDTRFVLTNAKKDEVVRTDLNDEIELTLLSEELKAESAGQKLAYFPARVYSTAFGKLYEKQGKLVPASVGKATIDWQYHREINWLRQYMQQNPDMTVIAFLQPAIPIVLLASQELPNRVIISERADPNRLMKKRYGRRFIEKYYTRADSAVFQTDEAKTVYPPEVAEKGTVIVNPLKDNLPEPYHGNRNHYLTTFCRISKQKNLPLLVEAFHQIHSEHPEYILRIIGDAPNEEGVEVLRELHELLDRFQLKDAVRFEPFMKNVHEAIINDAMYINSSDYEGISNAMLEAMAIGMPVVCTDCPIGGARMIIDDGKNGLLVPIKDKTALYAAMKRVLENKELSDRLSKNAAEIRIRLSLDRIVKQWEAEIT